MFTLMRILIRKKTDHTYKLQLELVQRRFFTFNGPSLLSLSFLFFLLLLCQSCLRTVFFSHNELVIVSGCSLQYCRKKSREKKLILIDREPFLSQSFYIIKFDVKVMNSYEHCVI